MTDTEFARAAQRLGETIEGAERRDAVAAACRGSGNPASLAWLAEALELAPGVRVVDLGGGTGGPAAWFADHYGCEVVVLDPVHEALVVAHQGLGVPGAVATGAALPVRQADVVMLLGVLSVVDERFGLLQAASAVASKLGLLVWCATGSSAVHVAGSSFPTDDHLRALLRAAGWHIVCGPEAPTLPVPPSWRRIDVPVTSSDEAAVTAAVEDGDIHARLIVCRR